MNQKITVKKLAISMAIVVAVFVFASCSKKQSVEQNNQQSSNQNQQQVQQGDGSQETELDTSDWQTYQDEKYGFELSYPETWELVIEKINPNVNNSEEAFFFKKDDHTYFAVFPYGGLGYGIKEPRVTYEKFKGKDAKMFWYESSFPNVIYLINEIPDNWNSENRIEIVISKNDHENERLLNMMYEKFEFTN